MPPVSGIELGALGALAALGLVAARLDVVERRLPNWLAAITLLAGLITMLVMGGPQLAASALLHAALALIGGMLFFAAGMIGGGDAKFYAAVASWFALRDGLYLLVSVTLGGLVLLVLWALLWRRRRGAADQVADRDDPFAKLPYGVAIALGGVASFAMLSLRG
jgi:prepilin peptidase CpaA